MHLRHFIVAAHGCLFDQLSGAIHQSSALLNACLSKGILEHVVAVSANL
jgi:hypothetical protein